MNTPKLCFRMGERCVAVLLLAAGLQAGAAERTLTIKDYTCRGFAPDLVQYRVDGLSGSKGERLRLLGADGKSLPVQWAADPSGKGGLAGFVAALPHDETATYRLDDSGSGSAAKGELIVTAAKDQTVLANGLFSVALPAAIDKTYDPPAKADSLPPPILTFTSGGSKPMGAAKLLTTRPVKRLRVWLAARGPVYADAWYELTWAEGGYYRCRVRVIDGVPLAQVMEEYDLGKLDGTDFWELSLTQGWQPDQFETARPWGNGGGADSGSIAGIESLVKQPLWRMSVDNGLLGHLGFFRKDQRAADSNNYPMAGVVMLRKGEWRRVNTLEVRTAAPADVRVCFPMSARDTTWQRDIGSVSSPFSMHSLDPAVPATYGRRHWGLMLSQVRLPREETASASYGGGYKGQYPYNTLPPFARARTLYGVVTLDQYKDYILDWPFDAAPASAEATAGRQGRSAGEVKYPRLTQAGASWTNSAVPAGRDKQIQLLYDRYLNWIPNFYLSCPAPTHHATADNYTGAWLADSLLGSPDLTPAQRQDIRARLALILYLQHEPGALSFGIGSHPGNPNMGWARFFPGVAYLGLLPDHPMYARWADFMSRQSEYELGKGMAPGGAWLEYGTYHFHGFRALPMFASLDLAKPPNIDTLFDYAREDLDYIMNLLSAPDPRYQARMIPGLANSGPNTTSRLVEGANALDKNDPELAARLLWAWKENGSAPGALPAPADLQPKPADLTSRYFPGFGIVFRAHQGPDETWMMLRNGFQWSHWTIDPGHFVMSSRGAVLVPSQPYQYYDSTNKTFDMANTVRFGAPENQMPYGWPDSNVLDYFFGQSVDYAWSSAGVPDWFIDPGVSEAFRVAAPNIPNASARPLAPEFKQQPGAFQWDRQVLFLKGKTATSPNYFVFRDSTRGAPSTPSAGSGQAGSGQAGKLASYLNFNLLGRKANLTIEGPRISLDTEWPVKLEMLFAQSEPLAPALLEENQPFQWAEVNLPPRPKGEIPSRDWLSNTGSVWRTGAGKPATEQRVLLRIAAAPDQGYFYVLFPRDEKEPVPAVKRLADGVLSITHREGTDTVFLSSLPIKYEGGGVQFEGCAGAVRLSATEMTLALAGGSGRVGYKGKVIEGATPFERHFPLAGLAAGVEKQSSPVSHIAIPTGEAGDEVTPGLRKKVEGDVTRYRVQSALPVLAQAGAVQVEACNAAIEVATNRVRFVVPDRSYVRLSVAGVGVRGLGPFDLTFTPTNITGTVDGTLRTLVSTWPEKIVRPMFHLDDRLWYAGWADDPCISKTPDRPQFAIAFAVFEGSHKVEVGDWKFPAQPPVPPVAKAGF